MGDLPDFFGKALQSLFSRKLVEGPFKKMSYHKRLSFDFAKEMLLILAVAAVVRHRDDCCCPTEGHRSLTKITL
jgi:hypothetical protein